MKKVAYKYWPYTKQKSWSRSGQIRFPNQNVVQLSCDTCFLGHLGRRIRCWHSFFKIWTEERSPSGQKFGQVGSNFRVQNVLTKICLSCAVLYKDSKNVIHFFGTTIRNAKKCLSKMWRRQLYLVFSHWTARKQDIVLKFCVSDGCMYLDRIYSVFWINWKIENIKNSI